METREIMKARREELGLTQTELALRVGYKDKSTIAKIERGDRSFPVAKVGDFAKALHISSSELLAVDDDLADLGNRLSPKEFALLTAFRSADAETQIDILRRLGIR